MDAPRLVNNRSKPQLLLWIQEAAKQQKELVTLLWCDHRFRLPMLALWLSDLGGSLHSPVVMYFYMRLGATPMDIGALMLGMRAGTIFLSPVYGRLVDKLGIVKPLCWCVTCCGLGCVLRGVSTEVWQLFIAQFLMGIGGGSQWSMVKGFIATRMDESQRPLLVLGFRVQMTLLSLSRVGYPALDSLLLWCGLTETLPRYRGEIGTCAFFCWIGIFILLCNCRCNTGKPDPSMQSASSSTRPAEETTQAKSLERKDANNTRGYCGCTWDFAAISLFLAIASCGQSLCMTLWPLYIKHHFGWAAREYAYLSFVQILLLTGALALYPKLVEGVLGQRQSLQTLTLLSVITLSGFAVMPGGQLGGFSAGILHAGLAAICMAILGVMCPGAEAAASLCLPPEMQGSTMGVLNAIFAIGALVGHLLGPALWSWSLAKDADRSYLQLSWGPVLAHGRAPFLMAGCLLLTGILFLSSVEQLDKQADSRRARNGQTQGKRAMESTSDPATTSSNDEKGDACERGLLNSPECTGSSGTPDPVPQVIGMTTLCPKASGHVHSRAST